MPEYNVTVKDVSPLISYSSGWSDGSGDAAASSYTGSRFHATQAADAHATLTFYGTACYFVGAKRTNHGRFTVTLDNATTPLDGNTPPPDQFQQTLFSKAGLPLANHTLTITNGDTAGQFVDIDYLVFTTGDGKSDAPTNSTFDDTDTRITYSGTDWTLQSNSIAASQYHNNTFHTTTKGNAQANISFEGNAAYVFGGTGKTHGPYTVSVDNGPPVGLNGTTITQENFQVLLYYTGTLASGTHHLVVTNMQDGQSLDVDFVSSVTFADSISAPASSSNPRGTAKTPVIAGTISGVCIAIAWTIALIWFWLRRKKRRARTGNLLDDGPDAYIIPPDPAVLNGVAQPGEYRQTSDSNNNMSMGPVSSKRAAAERQAQDRNRYTNYSDQPTSGYTSSHAPLSSASGSRSEYPSSPEAQNFNAIAEHRERRTPTVPQSVSYTGSEKSGDPENRSDPQPAPASGGSGSGSDARLPIPPERQQELAASRMRIPDRPQDWGPIREEDLLDLELPPNYQQATEPLPHGSPAPAPVSSSSGGSGGGAGTRPS